MVQSAHKLMRLLGVGSTGAGGTAHDGTSTVSAPVLTPSSSKHLESDSGVKNPNDETPAQLLDAAYASSSAFLQKSAAPSDETIGVLKEMLHDAQKQLNEASGSEKGAARAFRKLQADRQKELDLAREKVHRLEHSRADAKQRQGSAFAELENEKKELAAQSQLLDTTQKGCFEKDRDSSALGKQLAAERTAVEAAVGILGGVEEAVAASKTKSAVNLKEERAEESAEQRAELDIAHEKRLEEAEEAEEEEADYDFEDPVHEVGRVALVDRSSGRFGGGEGKEDAVAVDGYVAAEVRRSSVEGKGRSRKVVRKAVRKKLSLAARAALVDRHERRKATAQKALRRARLRASSRSSRRKAARKGPCEAVLQKYDAAQKRFVSVCDEEAASAEPPTSFLQEGLSEEETDTPAESSAASPAQEHDQPPSAEFAPVVKAIDTELLETRREHKQAKQDKEHCDADTEKLLSQKKELEQELDIERAASEELLATIKATQTDRSNTESAIKSTQKTISDKETQRKSENQVFQEDRANESAAIAALRKAATRLSQPQQANDPNARSKFGQVIALLEKIRTEMEKGVADMEMEESDAVRDFEENQKNLGNAIETLKKQAAEAQVGAARLAAEQENVAGNIADFEKEMASLAEEEQAVNKSCGKLVKSFAKRNAERKEEMRGLKAVRRILAAGM